MLTPLTTDFEGHSALIADLEYRALLPAQRLYELHAAREVERVRLAIAQGGWGYEGAGLVTVVRPLRWDSDYFGVPCADLVRIYVHPETTPTAVISAIDATLAESGRRGIRMHTARVLADQLYAIKALWERGFVLVDTSMQLGAVYSTLPRHDAAAARMTRVPGDDDRGALHEIAETFVRNRFHTDDRIDFDKAAGVYTNWVDSAMEAGQIIVVDDDDGPAGFATYAPPTDDLRVGEVGLVIIAPRARGGKLFDPLVRTAAQRAGGRAVVTSTQVSNTRALRAFHRNGLRHLNARHVLHRWA